MRRTLAIALVTLLIAPNLSATRNDWRSVKKLKPDTPVQIQLWNGNFKTGDLTEATNDSVQLYTADQSNLQSSWQTTIPRNDIHRIYALRRHAHLPDSNRWMIAGAAVGGVIGVGAGAASDIKHGNNGRWVVGGLAGAILGFVAATAALAVVGTYELTKLPRHTKLIYESQSPPSPDPPQSKM